MTFRVLEELGAELDGAIEREQRRRGPRLFLLTLLATLCVTGVATASYLLTGSPIPGAHERDVPDESTPLRSTARLMGIDAPDPGAGRSWDMRVSRSRTGQLCLAVGQVADGRLGIVGIDERWRALPQLGYDTCGQGPLLVGARVFDAPRLEDVRTVVSGVAGPGVTSVEVSGRALELGPEGTFLTVFAGYPEDSSPVVRLRGSTERTIALAARDLPRALDPVQGAWSVVAGQRAVGARKGQTCVQLERQRAREGSRFALSYPVCGDLREDPFFFEVAALPRAEDLTDRRQAFPWDFATPRTLVWGAASAAVERISVNGKPLEPSPKGFAAVFPEGTRPADLTVEVVLRGGEARRLVGGQNLRGSDGSRRVSEVREPIAIPASRRERPTSWLKPDRSTVRIAARRPDPSGGPDWAVRTFDARIPQNKRRLECAQLGRIVKGRFAGPELEDGGSCGFGGSRLGRVDTFVDDARAYAPRPVRTVVWGVSADRRVSVTTPSGVQPLPRTAGGAYLVLFDPSLTDRELRFRFPGERSRRIPVEPGSERIAARAPDPDGGAPYGLLEWRMDDGKRCHYAGRIVGDTVGGLDGASNAFHPYPLFEGGSCTKGGVPRARPVQFSVGGRPVGEGDPAQARSSLRTLPGRTIVSGFAHSDVRDITIQTPRDVRTLRPTGPSRAFLAVYDGEFFSGAITLTARFADGTTHRDTIPMRG